jgi:hypothetical protein
MVLILVLIAGQFLQLYLSGAEAQFDASCKVVLEQW